MSVITQFEKLCKLSKFKIIRKMVSFNPFNSHEWPRQNFSLQYQYNIDQTSDENKEKYSLGDN